MAFACESCTEPVHEAVVICPRPPKLPDVEVAEPEQPARERGREERQATPERIAPADPSEPPRFLK